MLFIPTQDYFMTQPVIHPTALISPKAKLEKNVSVGPFTVIHDNVEVGSNTRIDGYCELGYPTPLADGQPLIVGCNSVIRSHSVFYQGSHFRDGLVTGHRVTVREKTKAGKKPSNWYAWGYSGPL